MDDDEKLHEKGSKRLSSADRKKLKKAQAKSPSVSSLSTSPPHRDADADVGSELNREPSMFPPLTTSSSPTWPMVQQPIGTINALPPSNNPIPPGWLVHPVSDSVDRGHKWSPKVVKQHMDLITDNRYKQLYTEPPWPTTTDATLTSTSTTSHLEMHKVILSDASNCIEFTDRFDITNNTNVTDTAHAITRAAQALGSRLAQLAAKHNMNIMQAYRIQLTPPGTEPSEATITTTATNTSVQHDEIKTDTGHGLWKLSLTYDASFWFRYVLPSIAPVTVESTSISATVASPDEFARVRARAFVDRHISSIPYTPTDYLDKVNVIESPEQYCGWAADCTKIGLRYSKKFRETRPENWCNNRHSLLVCPQYVPRNGLSGSARCNWYASSHLLLKQDANWLLTCRPEHIRDILMLPCPPRHIANIALAQDSTFWVKVIQQAHELDTVLRGRPRESFAVSGIALNFGKWESGINRDPYALSCHGHVHFLLSKEAMIGLTHPTLKNKIQDPSNYAAADAKVLDLELHRPGSKALEQTVARIDNTMQQMQQEITEIRDQQKQILAHLATLVNRSNI